MADEPEASIVCESDAHDDNGGKRKPSCISSVGSSNDATLPGNRKCMSEHYNTLTSHRSPSSVADAIEHIAERIMVKAAEQATRVVGREANRTRK